MNDEHVTIVCISFSRPFPGTGVFFYAHPETLLIDSLSYYPYLDTEFALFLLFDG